jgi:hypothetical protein
MSILKEKIRILTKTNSAKYIFDSLILFFYGIKFSFLI